MKILVYGTELADFIKSTLASTTDGVGSAIVRCDLNNDGSLSVSMTVVDDARSESRTTEFTVPA